MKKNIRKKRTLNYQKIFCFASFIFILVCIFWYGGRFIYFYMDSKKTISAEAKNFATTIRLMNNERETFKQVNQDYYFYGNPTNNYVEYSNLIWRIVKVKEDNSIMLITDNIIGTLSYGDNTLGYDKSNIFRWLNKGDDKYSGILENVLNSKEKYLTKNSTCIDNVNSINNISCNNTVDNYYIGLLSLSDYVNTGSNNGFINNGKISYLANSNDNNEIWYINNEGKLETTDNNDILGFKAVITIKGDLEVNEGDGTSNKPYKLDKEEFMFGSYVKLGNDTFRVYDIKDNVLKLVLQNTYHEDNEIFKQSYSNNNYYHNDTIYGSLAYYMNNSLLNNLSYKNIVIQNTYSNGYYGSDNNYNYEDLFSHIIDTKVSVPSIGDIILNDKLDNYFTNTGLGSDSSFVYIGNNNGDISSKRVTGEANVVYCISINKDSLKVGNGSIDDPYGME